MKKLIAANWKMNGSIASAQALAHAVVSGIEANQRLLEFCEFVVCPPHPHLSVVGAVLKHKPVNLGGQDCALFEDGAYTGDVSARMLQDIGCNYVILGHSERRKFHKEVDADVAAKAAQAHARGLVTIICVGEQEKERNAGVEYEVVEGQIQGSLPETATAKNLVIAYEPVWAIGTGKTPTPEDVRSMHTFIREKLAQKLADSGNIRILYGGSVKPDNAESLLNVENVNGALIGGASLKAEQYLAIAQAGASRRAKRD